jgi:hypothetical protein
MMNLRDTSVECLESAPYAVGASSAISGVGSALSSESDRELWEVIVLLRSSLRSTLPAERESMGRIRAWTERYARRRFFSHWRSCSGRELCDLADDASQHLAIALTAPNMLQKEMAPGHTTAWCKRVVANFLRSELRHRERVSTLPLTWPEMVGSAEGFVAAREAFGLLVREVRSELQRAPSCRDSSSRLRLLDEFFESFLSEGHIVVDRRARNRIEQRRSRGRRVAREAWDRLKQRAIAGSELIEIAFALGLDARSS